MKRLFSESNTLYFDGTRWHPRQDEASKHAIATRFTSWRVLRDCGLPDSALPQLCHTARVLDQWRWRSATAPRLATVRALCSVATGVAAGRVLLNEESMRRLVLSTMLTHFRNDTQRFRIDAKLYYECNAIFTGVLYPLWFELGARAEIALLPYLEPVPREAEPVTELRDRRHGGYVENRAIVAQEPFLICFSHEDPARLETDGAFAYARALYTSAFLAFLRRLSLKNTRNPDLVRRRMAVLPYWIAVMQAYANRCSGRRSASCVRVTCPFRAADREDLFACWTERLLHPDSAFNRNGHANTQLPLCCLPSHAPEPAQTESSPEPSRDESESPELLFSPFDDFFDDIYDNDDDDSSVSLCHP